MSSSGEQVTYEIEATLENFRVMKAAVQDMSVDVKFRKRKVAKNPDEAKAQESPKKSKKVEDGPTSPHADSSEQPSLFEKEQRERLADVQKLRRNMGMFPYIPLDRKHTKKEDGGEHLTLMRYPMATTNPYLDKVYDYYSSNKGPYVWVPNKAVEAEWFDFEEPFDPSDFYRNFGCHGNGYQKDDTSGAFDPAHPPPIVGWLALLVADDCLNRSSLATMSFLHLLQKAGFRFHEGYAQHVRMAAVYASKHFLNLPYPYTGSSPEQSIVRLLRAILFAFEHNIPFLTETYLLTGYSVNCPRTRKDWVSYMYSVFGDVINRQLPLLKKEQE